MKLYDIVRHFEKEVSEYAGAKYGIAVDSCTSAIFLSCYYYFNVLGLENRVTIPKHTFFSVPASIIHAGGIVKFHNEPWKGIYGLNPYPIVDAACRFRRNMYIENTLFCLSFDARKHIPIGRGGMILTDNEEAMIWLRRARFHGRDEEPRMESIPHFVGWKAHMYPDDASRGLSLMLDIDDYNKDLELEYPDLSKMEVYNGK